MNGDGVSLPMRTDQNTGQVKPRFDLGSNGLSNIPELVLFLCESPISESAPKFDSMLNETGLASGARMSNCGHRIQNDFMEDLILVPPDHSDEFGLCSQGQSMSFETPAQPTQPQSALADQGIVAGTDDMMLYRVIPVHGENLSILWDRVANFLDPNLFQNSDFRLREPVSRTIVDQVWPRPPPKRFFKGRLSVK